MTRSRLLRIASRFCSSGCVTFLAVALRSAASSAILAVYAAASVARSSAFLKRAVAISSIVRVILRMLRTALRRLTRARALAISSPSLPSSAWERIVAKLRFAPAEWVGPRACPRSGASRPTFPSGAWERECQAASGLSLPLELRLEGGDGLLQPLVQRLAVGALAPRLHVRDRGPHL